MTKKDYELIAKTIRTTYENGDLDGYFTLVFDLADAFKANNPRFSENKFLEACGISSDD